MKLMIPRRESMFLMAKIASLGMLGEMLMMLSATSRMESTSALNSTFFSSGAESFNGVTFACK